jgi:hypothetical protein
MADRMLTGRVMDATAAERAGLVQYLVPDGAAIAKAEELAAKVSAMAPLTIVGVLHALPRIQDMSEADGLFVESLTAALSQSGPEAEARLAEFVAKRSAKVIPPAESSIPVGTASSICITPEPIVDAAATHLDEAAATQPLSMQRSTDDGA